MDDRTLTLHARGSVVPSTDHPATERVPDPGPAPGVAWILGLAGLLPFLFTAGAALFGPADYQTPALVALLLYGAVILSFLGAVHWGLALRPRPGEGWAVWPRLGLGVVPSLVAWVAMLLPLGTGLPLLAAGVLVTAAMEALGYRRGLLPRGYMQLRWVLSLGAALCLLGGLLAAYRPL